MVNMKELKSNRIYFTAVTIVVMVIMLVSVAEAKGGGPKPPIEGYIQDGKTLTGTYHQIQTDETEAQDYGMTVKFTQVDKDKKTFRGIVEYKTAAGDTMSALIKGSYDKKKNTMKFTTTEEIQSTPDQNILIGEKDSATLNVAKKEFTGSGVYKGETIATFVLK